MILVVSSESRDERAALVARQSVYWSVLLYALFLAYFVFAEKPAKEYKTVVKVNIGAFHIRSEGV